MQAQLAMKELAPLGKQIGAWIQLLAPCWLNVVVLKTSVTFAQGTNSIWSILKITVSKQF